MSDTRYKDIAEVAGVSPASVTRFFDKDKTVRAHTEKKILEAVKQLGVSIPVERVVGLIIPDAHNPYFTSIAFEFEKEFERRGWHLLISNSDGQIRRDLKLIERYKSLKISGLVYINSGDTSDELYTSLLVDYNDLPVLSFDRPLQSRAFDYLTVDSKKGTLQAIDYLFTKGHKKIAYLKGLKGTLTATQRFEAYQQAMAANRIQIDEKYIFEGDYQFGSGVECADILIKMKTISRPTAIICANDLMAIGLMQRLQKDGWKLPDQLSVIGFDDIPMSKWVYPALTTIAQPIRIMVNKSVNMLLKKIEANRQKVIIDQQTECIAPMLVPRESVSKPYDYQNFLKPVK